MDEFSPNINPQVAPEEPPPSVKDSPTPLAHEETPIIELVAPSLPQDAVRGSRLQPVILIGGAILLFIGGIWLSSFIRQIFPSIPGATVPTQQAQRPQAPVVTLPPDPYANWKTYFVVSGFSRKAVDGVSFKMPPGTNELFCDGTSCSSQGAYLPGGSRFTVAARGGGQILADYRGKIVTDFGGRPFVTNATVVGGRPALGFVGDFTGSTVTGYTFTKMRGVMISVTDTLSLEVNHFATSGISSDFAADDALFTKILNSFTFTGLPMPAVPVVSPTTIPTATPTTTP